MRMPMRAEKQESARTEQKLAEGTLFLRTSLHRAKLSKIQNPPALNEKSQKDHIEDMAS